jgi:hypothetical protein
MSWVRENRYRNWNGRQGRAALFLSKDGLALVCMGLCIPKQQGFQIVPYLMAAKYKYFPSSTLGGAWLWANRSGQIQRLKWALAS